MSKNPVFAFLITALMITVATPAFPEEELFDTATASRHMEQGVTLLKVKQYDAAIKEFEESASINPDAQAYYYLGYAYYLKGRGGDEKSRKNARDNFAKAYEIDPSFTPSKFKSTETLQTEVVTQHENQTLPSGPDARKSLPQSQPTSTTTKPNP